MAIPTIGDDEHVISLERLYDTKEPHVFCTCGWKVNLGLIRIIEDEITDEGVEQARELAQNHRLSVVEHRLGISIGILF